MKIRVDDIREKPLELTEEADPASLPQLAALVESGEAVVTAPVSVKVRAEREFDHIRVTAEAATSMRLSCSRCLTDYEAAIRSSFMIFYRKGDPQVSTEEEVELSEVDLVGATYQGDEIDLTAEIGDQIVMEVPLRPLCRDNCRGLCSTCGADLNQGECGCNREGGSLRFSVLKELKLDK